MTNVHHKHTYGVHNLLPTLRCKGGAYGSMRSPALDSFYCCCPSNIWLHSAVEYNKHHHSLLIDDVVVGDSQ